MLPPKKSLIQSGVNIEYLRLYCRALSNRLNFYAERRLAQYQKDNFQVIDYQKYYIYNFTKYL